MGLFSRPGLHTSEFAVAVLTVAANIANAAADWTSTHDAAIWSAPAVAYILSRGLAKYETRGGTTPPAG